MTVSSKENTVVRLAQWHDTGVCVLGLLLSAPCLVSLKYCFRLYSRPQYISESQYLLPWTFTAYGGLGGLVVWLVKGDLVV